MWRYCGGWGYCGWEYWGWLGLGVLRLGVLRLGELRVYCGGWGWWVSGLGLAGWRDGGRQNVRDSHRGERVADDAYEVRFSREA